MENVGTIQHSTTKTRPLSSSGTYVKALFDFDAENDTELSIRAGDIIRITNDIDAGWWEGLIEDGTRSGRRGLFPSNYVEKVPYK